EAWLHPRPDFFWRFTLQCKVKCYGGISVGESIQIRSRSMGVKLIVVCALALLVTIPALFVGGLVEDRTHRAAEVVKEISQHVGGQQTFLGPTLAIPYNIPPQFEHDF